MGHLVREPGHDRRVSKDGWKVNEKVTLEEMEEAEHISREWNNTQPLPEVQAKYVHIYSYFQCS